MELASTIHDLKTLVLSLHPVVVIETAEEERVTNLLDLIAAELELGYFDWTVTRGLRKVPDGGRISTTRDPSRLIRHLQGLSVEAIFLLKDFAPHLRKPELTRAYRELAQAFAEDRSTMILTGPSVELPDELEHRVVRFHLGMPTGTELKETVKQVLRALVKRHDVELRLTQSELAELVRALRGLTLNQVRQVVAYAVLEDGRFCAEDVPRILARKARAIQDGGPLEFYPVESNRFELGGLTNLKRWLERSAVGFTDEARELNLAAPRGILLVGVQGCGKSLAAKALARQWRLPLLKLDPGRLFDKYVGESEKNLRRALDLAESMAPCVLWVDELEKVLSGSSGHDADGGLSQRMFGFFLTWMQEKKPEVFVVATANAIQRLPPELLRKGRFDEIFFVDLPDADERRQIFDIHLKLRKQSPQDFDRTALVDATDGYSGAELEQVVVAALYRALHERTTLDTTRLLAEIRETIPLSVSRREDIGALRETGKRFVSAR